MSPPLCNDVVFTSGRRHADSIEIEHDDNVVGWWGYSAVAAGAPGGTLARQP